MISHLFIILSHINFIPEIALFNYKTNILKNATNHENTHINILRTVNITKLNKIIFYDDQNCMELLQKLENEWQMRWLTESYYRYEDGRIRSDMCRLAMLWNFGGYYFDNDIFMLKNIRNYIYPVTDFVTCKTTTLFKNNPTGFFQAFIASKPHNKIFKKALYFHVIWFDYIRKENKKEIDRITGGTKNKPNLGTIFLRDAFIHLYGDIYTKRLEKIGFSYVQKKQLFFEESLKEIKKEKTFNTKGLCIPCEVTNPCGFTVFDKASGEPLFKSRIMNYENNKTCKIFCKNTNCISSNKKTILNTRTKNFFRKKSMKDNFLYKLFHQTK